MIFEFSDQNIMEMMQTVRGLINLLRLTQKLENSTSLTN